VSQPFDRGASVPAPGELDESLGEFWVGDPWAISDQNNLSGYERNRTYLNVDGRNFLDVSYLTGADSDGDGRCAVAADFNLDGRQDLIVRQAGGGPLQVYQNQFPARHWLDVSLVGTRSNRLGIGARLTARVGGRNIVRELFPVNSYRSQALSRVHFGLGDSESVDKLTIVWPSGKRQELTAIKADRHVVVREGQPGTETVTPGTTIRP
jgi:hypothetical protein